MTNANGKQCATLHWRPDADVQVDPRDRPASAERRALLIAFAAWPALARVGQAHAQSKKSPVVIGWLSVNSRKANGHWLIAFKEGMAALGWKEGLQFVVEERWADGQLHNLPALAEELAAKKPSIIVAAPNPSVAAAAKAAPKIPIVQANGSDPVGAGFAASLARPGGMITGLTNITSETNEKLLELLLAAVPKLRRVGFLHGRGRLQGRSAIDVASRAAARGGIEARFAEASRSEDIAPAITSLAKEGVQALVLMSSSFFTGERTRILKLAQAQGWPVVASQREFAEDGALMSYGADRTALVRRSAYYVDRILKGAKPGDLPIEQPTTFELVLNMKTANAFKLTIPPEITVRVDKVID